MTTALPEGDILRGRDKMAKPSTAKMTPTGILYDNASTGQVFTRGGLWKADSHSDWGLEPLQSCTAAAATGYS